MSCKLTATVGDDDCEIKGPANTPVTLKLVATKGSALFESASYEGAPLITGATDELSFTTKPGRSHLSMVITFSSTSGAAELHEKCEQNTLLDGDITAVNNGKLYRLCCPTGADGPATLKTAAKKKGRA